MKMKSICFLVSPEKPSNISTIEPKPIVINPSFSMFPTGHLIPRSSPQKNGRGKANSVVMETSSWKQTMAFERFSKQSTVTILLITPSSSSALITDAPKQLTSPNFKNKVIFLAPIFAAPRPTSGKEATASPLSSGGLAKSKQAQPQTS